MLMSEPQPVGGEGRHRPKDELPHVARLEPIVADALAARPARRIKTIIQAAVARRRALAMHRHESHVGLVAPSSEGEAGRVVNRGRLLAGHVLPPRLRRAEEPLVLLFLELIEIGGPRHEGGLDVVEAAAVMVSQVGPEVVASVHGRQVLEGRVQRRPIDRKVSQVAFCDELDWHADVALEGLKSSKARAVHRLPEPNDPDLARHRQRESGDGVMAR
mmetsp:Transcript_24294/g.81915  ORF Transcript_24294/g.81915 Transcript_24294/m.81915 type:complete len:217 (-) Transcript_24294:373-1023(-)